MARVTVQIKFAVEGKPTREFERETELPDLRDPGGDEFVARELFASLDNMARWGAYYEALPDVSRFIRPTKLSFDVRQLFSDYDNRSNTVAMWFEIGRTLLRVKGLLARARAFHDLQSSSVEDARESEHEWHMHLRKMEKFDQAIMFLGKVSDLVARLVFERLGASMIPNLDLEHDEWERRVTLGVVRENFERREENDHLLLLPEAEYQTIRQILKDLIESDAANRIWKYRNRLLHRIAASVDFPELYSHMESRAWEATVDAETGKQTGRQRSLGGRKMNADHAFLDLYADASATLAHFVSVLKRLEDIPRFGPEAIEN